MYKNLAQFTASESPAACRSLARVIITLVVWAEQQALYTHFLHRPASMESNVQKLKRVANVLLS